MTDTVSRRGVLVGGVAVSAASCTTPSHRRVGDYSVGTSQPGDVPFDDRLAVIDEHADYTRLGALIVAYAMDKAARLRVGDKFTKKSISVNPEFVLCLDCLDDCCKPHWLIAKQLYTHLDQYRSEIPFKYYEPSARCNDCAPV